MFKILIFSLCLITVNSGKYDDSRPYAYEDMPCDAGYEDDEEMEPVKSDGCPREANGNCDPGWKNFTRPSGEWCMKVFFENMTTFSNAQRNCEEVGGTLSSFQNQLEMLYVTYTVVDRIFPESGIVWVGMKRTDACLNQLRNTNCTGFTAFEWTDGSANGTQGFHWTGYQPDNARLSQNCAMLIASPNRNVDGYQTGMLDDVDCDFDFTKPGYSLRSPKAYVCGKKPDIC